MSDLDAKFAQARRHDEERNELNEFFSPFLKEWLKLQHEAGMINRDDATRGYSYEEVLGDEVIFYAPAYSCNGYRGDDEDMPETYVSLPLDFIRESTAESDTKDVPKTESREWGSLGAYP